MDSRPLAFVIEDNEDQNLVFAAAVERAGYQAEPILDGRTAQKRLAETVPDMIILDLHLPGVNGGVLLGQIRSDQRLADVPVLLATADAEFAAGLQSGADLVLLKPVSFSQLSELASRYIRR